MNDEKGTKPKSRKRKHKTEADDQNNKESVN